jgi:hypothetical protein
MAHTAVVVFTAKNGQRILKDGGSRDWRLNADRARRSEFLVCTQNRHHPDEDSGVLGASHGAAFLIGRITDVVPSQEPGRWLICIGEYVACDIPNIWGKLGHARYPVRYTTLEELGIDLHRLPPFRPVEAERDLPGFQDMSSPPPAWQPHDGMVRGTTHLRPSGEEDPWTRLDALLRQIDRIPDLPVPTDPLEWDAQGLPR